LTLFFDDVIFHFFPEEMDGSIDFFVRSLFLGIRPLKNIKKSAIKFLVYSPIVPFALTKLPPPLVAILVVIIYEKNWFLIDVGVFFYR